MYIIFGGSIKKEKQENYKEYGAESILCFMENRENAIEIASNYVSYGVTKQESWSQVYDLDLKCIIWNKINENQEKESIESIENIEGREFKKYKECIECHLILDEKINININN